GGSIIERGPVMERGSVVDLCAGGGHRDCSRAEDRDRSQRDDQFVDHVLAPWIQALLLNAIHIALSTENDRTDRCSCGTLKFNDEAGSPTEPGPLSLVACRMTNLILESCSSYYSKPWSKNDYVVLDGRRKVIGRIVLHRRRRRTDRGSGQSPIWISHRLFSDARRSDGGF